MRPEKTELNNCPFCGSDDLEIQNDSISDDWRIICWDCEAKSGDSGTRTEAVNKWNARANT